MASIRTTREAFPVPDLPFPLRKSSSVEASTKLTYQRDLIGEVLASVDTEEIGQ